MVFKKIIIILIVASLTGCGLIPAYRRAQSDYSKTSYMLMAGGSKGMVKSDWGAPDRITVLEHGIEIWTYENRENGKTFIFYFNERGRFARVQICNHNECE